MICGRNEVKSSNSFNIPHVKLNIRNDCSGENQELSREIAIKNIQRCLENFSSGEKGVLSEIKIVTEFLLNYIQVGFIEAKLKTIIKLLLL